MFNAQSLPRPNGLQGLNALGTLAALPSTFAASFGRVARSYPTSARTAQVRTGAAATDRFTAVNDGFAAAVARLAGRALARLADAVVRAGEAHARRRSMRLTALTLERLDAATLRDIGMARSEISSVAAEHAGVVEATRMRAWREIGTRAF